MGIIEDVAAVREEQRVLGALPFMPWMNPLMRFDIGGPAHPSRSYTSPEGALALPALYAGVNLLCGYAGSMPLQTFNRYNDQNGMPARRLWTGPSLFDQPSLTGTPFDWIFSSFASAILQGMAWGYITGKDGYGFPTGIEWIPKEDVFVQEAMDMRSMNPLDAKVYVFGKEMKWYGPDAELFYVKGFGLPGRLEGISLLMQAALTITAGQEAQRYGTDWFKSGGHPPGTFQSTTQEVNAEQAAELRAELVKSLRRREPLVYGSDWVYTPITVAPSEAQFIESMQLTASHIAAFLNLPANRLSGTTNDSLHYSSQEQDALQILEALRPWLVRFEQAFNRIIPRNREAMFNRDSILSTDLQTRMQIYQIKRNIGFENVDELRAREDLPPLPDGIGQENLPQELMVSLGARAGAIPKSLLKAIVLEMDIATDRLIKLEKTYISQGKLPQAVRPQPGQAGVAGSNSGNSGSNSGGLNAGPGFDAAGNPGPGTTVPPPPPGKLPIGMPNAPLPLAQDPASFLASLISVQRSYAHIPEAKAVVDDVVRRIWEAQQDIERRESSSQLVTATDMLAPWMRSSAVADIVLS